MIKKYPLILLILALLIALILWALLRGDSAELVSDSPESNNQKEQLVSAVQPLSASNGGNTNGVISGSFEPQIVLSDEQNSRLKKLFERALASDNSEQSIERYQSIIEEFPSAIEPHLNLASLYANNGDLDKARQTLMQGFERNGRANLLFSSLQKLHGALAAAAYSKAINTNSFDILKVDLPSTTGLITTLDQESTIESLKTQISTLSSEVLSQNKSAVDAQAMLVLTSEMSSLQDEFNLLKQTHAEELASLNSSLSTANESLLSSQVAEREALARVVRAEQGVSDQLAQAAVTAKELATQENAGIVTSLQEQVSSLTTQLADAQQTIDASRIVASINTTSQEVAVQEMPIEGAAPTDLNGSSTINVIEQQKSTAIELVKSWAKGWSAQDVDTYVSHYADNYSSSKSLTRKQWLAQRQVRLSNKAFINVNVSNFQIKDLDGQFSVTFSQNYKSNTVDDTVIKRLIFNKKDGAWANAKIVNESIVSR